MNITKETFLKAEDSKNRDAMLYDMLAGITEKLNECKELKKEVDGFKTQVSLVKRLFLAVAAIFTVISAWLAKS
jgi:adenine C2-methylase RlmN of 23S rRNA A2503 and tRNA A37